MIAFLRGVVLENDGDTVVVEVNGIGYQVLPSATTLAGLPAGGRAELHVHSHFVKDEPIRLYGFADPEERRLFQTLISVQGVGPRVALAILAGLPRGELVQAISDGDVARLTQVKGVGRKIAERLALELRDKIAAFAAARPAPPPALPARGVPAGVLGEVHGALLQLGFRPAEFESLLEQMDPDRPVADLMRQALSVLGRR